MAEDVTNEVLTVRIGKASGVVDLLTMASSMFLFIMLSVCLQFGL